MSKDLFKLECEHFYKDILEVCRKHKIGINGIGSSLLVYSNDIKQDGEMRILNFQVTDIHDTCLPASLYYDELEDIKTKRVEIK
jgi:hypothetical protein